MIWDTASGKELRTLEAHRDAIWGCAVAPDGSFVISGSWDGTLKLWDSSTGAELQTLVGHEHRVWGCAVSPDGSFVASTSWDNTVKLWDPVSGRELRSFDRHTDGVSGCAIAPDGSFVVSVSYDQTVRVWDPATGEELATLPVAGSLRSVAVSGTHPLIVCGDRAGDLYLLEMVGFAYGPIIVTATEEDRGPIVRCPKCWAEHFLDRRLLGQVIDCPTPACELQLRVNPFVVSPLRE